MPGPVLKYEVKNQIAYITLNRPEKRNALDDELSHELIKVWPKFEADERVRVGQDIYQFRLRVRFKDSAGIPDRFQPL